MARKGATFADKIINGVSEFLPDLNMTFANYVGDTDEKGNFIFFTHSPINSKYENAVVEYILQDGTKEEISFPFASNYAYLGDFYNKTLGKIDNLYKDQRNIRYVKKDNSLFFKVLENDNERRKNNIEYC